MNFLTDIENSNFDKLFLNKKIKSKGRNIRTLSEGEQCLAIIKRKLQPGKNIYICDEIFSSLDDKHQEEILTKLLILKKDALVIIVQHNFELENEADLLIHLKKDRIESKIINKELNFEKQFIFSKELQPFSHKLILKSFFSNKN